MFVSIESERVSEQYSKIEKMPFGKIFDKFQQEAILEANQHDIMDPKRWFQVPIRKVPARARFQFPTLSDDDGHNEWCDHFKTVISNLKFHPLSPCVTQIGFSFLAYHPLIAAKGEENPYVYVSQTNIQVS